MTQQRSSSVPQVWAAAVQLYARALEGQAFDGTNIVARYSTPPDDQAEVEVAYCYAALDPTTQTWALLGARERHEQYVLKAGLEVRRSTLGDQEAVERAWALFALIEVALRADVTLGLEAGTFKFIEVQVGQASGAVVPAADGKGYWADVHWDLLVKSRI